MRKITLQGIDAMNSIVTIADAKGLAMTRKNLSVRDSIIVYPDRAVAWRLWDNPIAIKCPRSITLSDCGFSTATTAERLNGLLEAFSIHTQSGDKVFYSPACGFYVWKERQAKNNRNKTVRFRHVIAKHILNSNSI